MTPEQIRVTVLRLLGNIAPEADLSRLKADVSFRDQLDVDSMDLLNFAIALHKEFGIEIPERDYAKLGTIDACVTYLKHSLGAED